MVSISLVLILASLLFIDNEYVYGAAGANPPWIVNSTPPAGGVKWTGCLVVTGQIVDVPGLPLLLPPGSSPVDPRLIQGSNYKDRIFCTT